MSEARNGARYAAIGIGVSAGGLKALRKIIPVLPKDYPIPIIIVQHRLHTPEDFLADFMNRNSDIEVKEAQLRAPIEPECVYIGPSGYHLLVERDKTFSLSIDPPVNYVIPSIDVLFQSAARAYQEKFVGVLLTGANHDGSQGLKSIQESGGLVVVQDPKTAQVPVMPQSAIDLLEVDHIIALDEIGTFLKALSMEGE